MPDQHKTADELLALADTRTEEVWIEEWGTFVTVTGLTKRQQMDIRNRSIVDGELSEDLSQQYLILEGITSPRFTEAQLPALLEKSAAAVDTALKRVLELSGMKPEDLKKKEARFPAGTGPTVPVRTGEIAPQDGSGVAVGEAGSAIG